MKQFAENIIKASMTLDNVRAVLEEVQTDIQISMEDEESVEYWRSLFDGAEDFYDTIGDILMAIDRIEDDLQPYLVGPTDEPTK